MNKPVAWYSQRRQYFWTAKPNDANSEDAIPLYTHPVKELTKNIADIWRMSDQSIQIVFTSCRSASEFEAILRKAQKK